MTPSEFQKQFLRLILAAWVIPAVFGLSFLMFIEIFTVDQMISMLTSPLEPIFVLSALTAAYFYFKRISGKICRYIENPEQSSNEEVVQVITGFPHRFWVWFLTYLIVAPVTVIYSAELYSDFVATPIDWFRVNLVALIVSILVGLPIFFLILDLFGKIIVDIPISKPIISIKLKVVLIGALVPLLIDTMLVQYYWTRTGFFSFETFVIWLSLEIVAIIGSLIFAKSFGQSLEPLALMLTEKDHQKINANQEMQPKSIDELGILTIKYRDLLTSLQEKHNALELKSSELEDKVNERTRELKLKTLDLQETNSNLQAAKKELIAHRDNLQVLVENKTHDLEDAKNKAEKANEAKTEFLSNISHELRTPMHAILSYSSLGLRKIDAPKEKLANYFTHIRNSGDRLLGLIDNLLDITKLESGNMEFSFNNENLYSIVNDSIKELSALAGEKNKSLELKSDTNEYIAEVDASAIHQVVLNLLSNALKFSPVEDAIVVSIQKALLESSDSNYLPGIGVSVSNNGVDIPERELNDIFDAFIQSSRTNTGAGGTGLGLSISRSIIEGHHGRIWAENRPEGGAIFQFILPIKQID